MLRRLHHIQPESFAFTPANQKWAEAQMAKFPEGRQASAIIPLLWRAQEQEGWLSRPAIESVASMLGLAYIRALEVATFYFMFQLQPVGSVAHIQICGTTSCMICGAEDLVAVCKNRIATKPHDLSPDGKFSWEEVECLGACANAPMAQIGKDYYEDLTAARLSEIIDELAAGNVPAPGPQNGRFAAEPQFGLTSLLDYASGHHRQNVSVEMAATLRDTVKRIDGTELEFRSSRMTRSEKVIRAAAGAKSAPAAPKPAKKAKPKPAAAKKSRPAKASKAAPAGGKKPRTMTAPRKGGADDLKLIKGVGPKLEVLLNKLGFFHFDQVAKWGNDEVSWVDQNLEGFKGRVSRDGWVAQAKRLAAGEETEFSSRAKKSQ